MTSRGRLVTHEGAPGRRVGIGTAVALAIIAFSGLQCVQDLIGPAAKAHVYTFESVGPTRFSANIGDTIAAPSAHLSVDGAPATVGIAVAVLQGTNVARLDSAGRIVVLGSGDAVLRLRPLSTALLVDTLHVDDTLHTVVPVLGATGPDTVFSLQDTVRFTAQPRTRAGSAIAEAPVVWRLTSGAGVVTLLDSVAGTVRAETNGDAVLTGVSDTATVQRTLHVRQKAASVVPAGAILLHWAGHARQMAPQVRDARAQPVASASLSYVSRSPAVATVSGTGLVTAVGDGTTRIVTSASGPGGGSASDSTTVVVQTARLAVLSGNNQVASVGATLPAPLVVKLVDVGGAAVADSLARIVFRVTAGSGWFGGADSAVVLTDSLGHASASLTFGAAVAPTTVQATGTGLAGGPVTFTETPAPPARLRITVQPSSVPAGGSISPVVKAEVRDTFNTLVAAVPESVSVVIVPGTGTPGAALLGTTKVATSAGVATFPSLTLDKVGAGYRLIVSATGLAPDTSSAFSVTAGAPDHMAFLAQPLGARAGVPVYPAVQVKVVDASGNAVPAFQGDVTLSIGRVPATGSDRYFGTATVSAINGVATFGDFGIQTAAIGYKLRAASSGLAAILSDLFDVSGAPDTLRMVSGNAQGGIVNAVLADSLVVKVVDASGIAVAGDTVVFRCMAGGGTFGGADSAVVLTVAGRAAAALKLGSATGTDTVVVRSRALAGRTVTFTATAVEAGNRLEFVTQPTTFNLGAAFNPAVQVRVKNGFGNTVTGATAVITLGVASGTGRAGAGLTGTTAVAASGGVATFTGLGVSRSGAGYRIVATATGIASDTSVAFDVLQVPASLVKDWGDKQNGTVGTSLTENFVMRVLDAAGDPIASDTVVYRVTSGVGTLYAGTDSVVAVTDAMGRALAGLTLGPAPGTVTVTARSRRLAGQSVTFTASATAAGRALQFITQPANIVAGTTFSPAIKVRVYDPATGVTDTSATTIVHLWNSYSVSLTGAIEPDGTRFTQAVHGVATFDGLGVAGPVGTGFRLQVSADKLGSAATEPFDVSVGAPARLAIEFSHGMVQAGCCFMEYVRILDAGGNLVTTATNTVTLSLAGGTAGAHLRGTLTVNAVDGVARFLNIYVDSVGAGYALSASSPGLTGVVGPTFIIVPSSPHHLVFGVPPTSVTAGAPMNEVHVFVEDSLGNWAGTANMAVTLTLGANPGGSRLLGTTSVPVVGGIAAFTDLRLRFPGTGYTLVAVTTDLPQVTSAPFDVLTGAASRLVFFVQPSTTLLSQAIAPAVQVQVQDTVGNLVTASTAAVTLAITTGSGGAGATLAGTATRNAAGGVATYGDLSIGTYGGDYTLTATSGGLASSVSNAFDVLSTTSDRVVVTSAPASASAGAPFDVSVEIRNTAGVKVATAVNAVTLSITGGTGTTGAHLRGALTVAAAGGVAVFHGLSVDSAGAGYTITARSPGLFSGTSAALSVQPAGRHHIAFRVQPTSRTAGNVFSPAIQVAVYDSLGNLQTDEPYSLGLSITPGSGAPDAVLSGTTLVGPVGGVWTFADLSIAKAATGYSLTASLTAPGLTAVSNTFSIVPGGAASIVITPSSVALSGAGSTAQLAAVEYDAYGNALTGASVPWSYGNGFVASVDRDGLVTAGGPGQTEVAVDSGAAHGYATITVATPELAPVNLWVPMASGTTVDFSAVWGSYGRDVHATGQTTCDNPATIHLGSDQVWRPEVTGATTCLTGLGGLGPSFTLASGSFGQLFVKPSEGADWRRVTSGTNVHLSTMWAASHATVFAVGENGTIGRYDLNTGSLELMSSGMSGWLWGVFGTSATNVFAGGADGTILHYDGVSWSRMTTPTTENVGGLWGTSANSVYAATGHGILHWNGSTWSLMSGTESVGAGGVWGSSDHDVYVPVANRVWHYDGSTWTAMQTGVTANLGAIWGTPPDGVVFAVGTGGTVVRGVRGATVAVTPASPTLTALGATQQLVAEAREPGGASVGGIRFTWTSADPGLATVDSTGLVTAVANGTATITATAPGGASGSVTVTVRQEPATIRVLTPEGTGANAGQTRAALAEVRDARSNLMPGYPVTWSSLNPAIATIDAGTGVVTAVGAGQTAVAARIGGLVAYSAFHVMFGETQPVTLWVPMASGTTADLKHVFSVNSSSAYAVGAGGTILHFDGSGWSPMSSGLTGELRSIGGLSDTLLWAGSWDGTLLRYDGATWRPVTPRPGFSVEAIWARTPREVYAVGNGGNAVAYDGTTWASQATGTTNPIEALYYSDALWASGEQGTLLRDWTSQSSGGTANLTGLWGHFGNLMFAVGWGGTILQWESPATVPSPSTMASGTTRDLWGVWGTWEGNVYAVGDGGTLLHWNGAAWSAVPVGTTADLHGVWGTADGSVFVVGHAGTILRGVRGATVAVMGAAPTLTALGVTFQFGAIARDPGGSLIGGVQFSWSSDAPAVATVDENGLVTAVGNGTATITATAPGGASGSTAVTVQQRASTVRCEPPGMTLNVETNPTFGMTVIAQDSLGHVMDASAASYSSLNPAVAVTGGGTVTAVAAGQATIEATMPGGATGSFVATVVVPGATAVNLWRPMTSGTTEYLRGVWGTSANDVFATSDQSAALHFDGNNWTLLPGQTARQGGAVWGTAANDVWAVGGTATVPAGAIVSHFDGTNWTSTQIGTTGALFGIWGASSRDIFAVGDGGALYHFDGSTWTLTQGGWQRFYGVWGSSSRDVFAVGNEGVIVHFDGTSWSAMSSGVSETLMGVWGASGSDVYVVGGNSGVLLHYDGTTWSQVASAPTGSVGGLWGASAGDLYLPAGLGLYRYDGLVLHTSASGLPELPYAVWGTSAHEVWAVGTGGMILQGFRGATIDVTPANPTITGLGNTRQLTVAAKDASGNALTGVTLTWTSSNESVATVDATGLVTSVGAGSATITAAAPGGASGSTVVTVSP